MKDKSHMIISIDVEKAFAKIQHPFLIKTLSKLGLKGAFLNIIKAIYERPTANIILNGQKLKSFPTKIRNKTIMPTFTTSIQYSIGSPSNQIRKIKGIQIGKEDTKLSLFADDMIMYIENSIECTKKLLNLINEFGKTAGYKVNTQKSKAFLYTCLLYTSDAADEDSPV